MTRSALETPCLAKVPLSQPTQGKRPRTRKCMHNKFAPPVRACMHAHGPTKVRQKPTHARTHARLRLQYAVFRVMIAPAVKRAFAKPKPQQESERPSVGKGLLAPLYHAKFDAGLCSAVKMPDDHDGQVIAAALADGSLVFVDGTSGRVMAKCDFVNEDPPNVLLFAGTKHVVHCCDDACVRVISLDGEIVYTHAVTEPAQDGKRPRCYSIDHAAALMLEGGAVAIHTSTPPVAKRVPHRPNCVLKVLWFEGLS